MYKLIVIVTCFGDLGILQKKKINVVQAPIGNLMLCEVKRFGFECSQDQC